MLFSYHGTVREKKVSTSDGRKFLSFHPISVVFFGEHYSTDDHSFDVIWRAEISTTPEISTIWRKLPFPKWPKYAPLTTKITISGDTAVQGWGNLSYGFKTLDRQLLAKK